jgi:biopolymer transport protein ExbD
MLHRRHRHRADAEPGELNITAFMNLMVILVPFLLITAVFSRLAILEVALPAPENTPQEQPEDEPLPPPRIFVRADGLTLVTPQGSEVGFPRSADGYELAGLTSALELVKREDLDKDAAVVMLEPDTDYDTLIQVMDAVRVTRVDEPEGATVEVPLFPQISLGEIPAGATP